MNPSLSQFPAMEHDTLYYGGQAEANYTISCRWPCPCPRDDVDVDVGLRVVFGVSLYEGLTWDGCELYEGNKEKGTE
jgi:hypothetical protein